jgi:hypothetical protein
MWTTTPAQQHLAVTIVVVVIVIIVGVVFVVFSMAQKELDLEFFGGLVGKSVLTGLIEASLIEKHSN